MLFCWHDLLILFLSASVLSFSSFHLLVVWGWGLWTDRVLLSPGLAQQTPNNNNTKILSNKSRFFFLPLNEL